MASPAFALWVVDPRSDDTGIIILGVTAFCPDVLAVAMDSSNVRRARRACLQETASRGRTPLTALRKDVL